VIYGICGDDDIRPTYTLDTMSTSVPDLGTKHPSRAVVEKTCSDKLATTTTIRHK